MGKLLVLSISDVVSYGIMWVGDSKSQFLMLRLEYRLGNKPLLQMLEVTTIGTHVGS